MRLRIVLLLLISGATLYAQEPLNGYIVPTNGDTLRGLITFSEQFRTPRFIKYQKVITDAPVTYNPSDVVSFYIEEKKQYFYTHTLDVDIRSVRQDSLLTDNSQPIQKQKTIFLLKLVEGPVSLYHHYDFKPHYFLYRNGKFEELIVVRFKISRSAMLDNDVATLDVYKQLLQNSYSDCETRPIKDIKFNYKDFSRFVNEYNECKQPLSTIYSYKPVKYPFRMYPMVFTGYSLSSLKFAGEDFGPRSNAVAQMNFDMSTSPVIGAGFELRRPSGRTFLATTLSYRSVKGSGAVSDNLYSQTAEISFNYLRLNFLVNFSFTDTDEKARPYIGVGLTSGATMGGKNNIRAINVDPPNDVRYNGVIRNFNSLDAGFILNAGVRYKLVRFELRGEEVIRSAPPEKTGSLKGIGSSFSSFTISGLVTFVLRKQSPYKKEVEDKWF